MENKTSKTTKHMKEESKYYKNKVKDGMKLIYIYYQMKPISIMNKMSRGNKKNKIVNKMYSYKKEFKR